MLRTVRLNAYPNRDRAQEEANGLTLAFRNSELARRPGFEVSVSPYQGEYHVNVTADVDTSHDGFLSLIICRTLASHCRAPVARVALAPPAPTPLTVARLGTARASITQRALAGRPPRLPRFPR